MQKALDAITKCVETKEGNLLELAVEAARVRATLGEISYACEKVVGRYKAVIRLFQACIHQKVRTTATSTELVSWLRICEERGRQPRIMVAKMGQDGHDRGAKVVARVMPTAVST